jgi:hypothetical protein
MVRCALRIGLTSNERVYVTPSSFLMVSCGTIFCRPEWRMIDGKTFEVLGAACDTIQDGDLHHISAVFPCGVIIVD